MAAWLAGLVYRYSPAQVLTLWSLSLPQVAATLAATTVGFRAGLLDERVLNSVLALMVVTATLGPALTGVAMARLREERTRALEAEGPGPLALVHRSLRVMVPIANPASERALLGIASQLIGGEEGRPGLVLPLAVVTPLRAEAEGRGSLALTAELARARQLLLDTEEISRERGIPSSPLLRVDPEVAGGIARAALEQGADLLVVGVGSPARLGRWLFGDLVDGLCRQAHCPVVVTRLLKEPQELRRLLVPIKDLSASALEQVQLAERIAASLAEAPPPAVRITLLHLHDPGLPAAERHQLREQLRQWLPRGEGVRERVGVDLQVHPSLLVESEILSQARQHDLVILRSQRRVVAGLPIAASDRASRLLRRLTCSTLVISDPLALTTAGSVTKPRGSRRPRHGLRPPAGAHRRIGGLGAGGGAGLGAGPGAGQPAHPAARARERGPLPGGDGRDGGAHHDRGAAAGGAGRLEPGAGGGPGGGGGRGGGGGHRERERRRRAHGDPGGGPAAGL